MKFCVVTPLFSIAGVPLAQLRLARALAAQGLEVDLVIGFVAPGRALPGLVGIRVLLLDRTRVRSMLAPLTRYFRTARPDVVFVAEDHLTAVTLLAATLARSKAKISGSSRVTPFDTYSNRPLSKRWALKWFMRAMMPRATVLTCVSKDMVDQYRTVFKSAPHVCVYNIVVDRDSKRRMQEPVDDAWLTRKEIPVLVAAGGLFPWKGFSDLLVATKEVLRTRPVRLLILGDGPLRSRLQTEIEALGLSHAVRLAGFVENPLKYFARADVFVLSSHVEGLPNVLVEAMMCGCTVVATNCPTGPREVLDDGKYGVLVPMKDPSALAAGILTALDHRTPKALLEEAVRPFSEAAVLRRHFDLLGLDAASVPASRATVPDL